MGWLGIVRLGLVQAALGAVVVLTTSTLNRVMAVELALPAMLPGALVALHYAVQILRPRLGHGSDRGGARTKFIVGGMAVLGLGAVLAALATAWMAVDLLPGVALAVLAYALIGTGVGACGTSLLVLLAKQVAPRRRAAAATIVWLMMMVGFVISAGVSGQVLDPFSTTRLVVVTAGFAAVALLVTVLAVWRIEHSAAVAVPAPSGSFVAALRQVWAEPQARRFTIFVFLSMLAYSAQELLLEPFAGLVFHLTIAQSARLAGVQHGGAFTGMLLVAIAASAIGGRRLGSLRLWTVGGCLASAAAVAALAASGFVGPAWPLRPSVFALGMANGCFTVAAIGSMMQLAGAGTEGGPPREGVRMGLWGAAQAVAFACGGLVGTGASDLARHLLASPVSAYAAVLGGEAVLFLIAAGQAGRAFQSGAAAARSVAPARRPMRAAIAETAGG